MRIRTLRRVLPALALLGASACDQGLTDVNKNPNSPEDVPVENVLASGIMDAVANENGVGAFGEWTTLYHTELWAQHIAQAQYNDEDNYTPRAGIPTQIWDVGFSNSLQDLFHVKQVAEQRNNNDLWAVAEIMSVYQFLTLTDLFGDIPYSEALNLEAGVQNPKYDAQKDIYPDLLTRLEKAAGMINRSENSPAFARGDLIYDGNMEGWYRFANSLRLRIAMRIADTELSAQARQAFADAWSDGVISSLEQAADLEWPGTQPAQNPIYEQIVLGGRTGDFRISASLTDRLIATNDPRLEVFAAPAASDGAFRGLANGRVPANYTINGKSGGASDFATFSSRFLAPDLPSMLMSYAEVLFLGAEGAARGWIGASAADLYRQAITASMLQYGIPQARITAYLAQPEVAYNGLPSIGVQKWIALFMAGPEAFTEFRRTGYPNLQPAANSTLEPGLFPARLPYPTEEALYNPKNYPTGVTITTPVWWMKR